MTGWVPVMAGGLAMVQVGALIAAGGADVTEHASATLPVKLLAGVTEMVEVVDAP